MPKNMPPRSQSSIDAFKKTVRVQKELALELRFELQAATSKWFDVMDRISKYRSKGMLNNKHIELIRSSLVPQEQSVPDVKQNSKQEQNQKSLLAPVRGQDQEKKPLAPIGYHGTDSDSDSNSDTSDSSGSEYFDPSYKPKMVRRRVHRGILWTGDVEDISKDQDVRAGNKIIPPSASFPAGCPLCQSVFTMRAAMQKHLTGHGDKHKISCPVRRAHLNLPERIYFNGSQDSSNTVSHNESLAPTSDSKSTNAVVGSFVEMGAGDGPSVPVPVAIDISQFFPVVADSAPAHLFKLFDQ